jgi:RNA polymerase sigma-70 factor (ECF subfamily)
MTDPDVEAARQGDARAFQRVFEAHHRSVYAVALRMTADESDAMDVAQDAFITAWRHLSSFRGESTIRTWLLGITIRLALQAKRKILRLRRREDVFVIQGSLPSEMSPSHGWSIDLERAIGTLPKRIRAAIVLHCIYGYSQAETARLMGSAEGTIKAQVHRGRQLLKEALHHG